MDVLTRLPLQVLQVLKSSGVTIKVAANIPEARPDLANQRPRGWPPGSTFHQPAAVHDSNTREIVITRNAQAEVLFHEIGHALDRAAGSPCSHGSSFMRMYNADKPTLQADGLTYLLQDGEAGPEEAYADSHAWFQEKQSSKQWRYPNLHAYWE